MSPSSLTQHLGALRPSYGGASLVADTRRGQLRLAVVCMVTALALALALALATPAHASFELVKVFGESASSGPKAEEGMPEDPGGMAVNESTGDIYVAAKGANRVVRFDAEGHFLEAWGWGVGDGKLEYERCGPDGAIPHCEGTYGDRGYGYAGEGPGEFDGSEAVAVDQATGDVYVMSEAHEKVIQEFTAQGSLITGFGVEGGFKEAISESPEDIHNVTSGGMAVEASTGNVYVVDGSWETGLEDRVMVFKPKVAGTTTAYEYAGRGSDLFTGEHAYEAERLVIDSHGDFYLAKANLLYKFAAGDLSTPEWEAKLVAGAGLAVDSSTGDAYYYAEKNNTVNRLSGATGKLIEAFPTGEENVNGLAGIISLAYSPNRVFGPGNPAGVIYGAYPETVNENGKFGRGLVFAQPPVFPPSIDAETVRGVGSTSASLQASIDPHGYETHYFFQYGNEDCSSHSCLEAPLNGADLGSGQEDLSASVAISGLQSGATYHYRVVATNAFGTTEGPDRTFTTYGIEAAGLPDHRVYELVSPPFKAGGEVFPINEGSGCSECTPGENALKMPMQSAEDGNSVVYEGFPFSATGAAVRSNEYVSRRLANGWQTRDLSSPMANNMSFDWFSPDLSLSVLTQGPSSLTSEAPPEIEDLYMPSEDGTLPPLLTTANANLEECARGVEPKFAGASSDLGHVLIEMSCPLTNATADAPEAPVVKANSEVSRNEFDLYEWVNGELQLVNVLPGNAAAIPHAGFGSGNELAASTESYADFSHVISNDGSRIFWSYEPTGQVYIRENGETTVEVPDPGKFVVAAADGASVLLNDGKLYDVEDGTLTDLTGGKGGFQGMAGASEDLSRVYFVDTQSLTGSEANGEGAIPQLGQDNLYLYESGAASPRFIATLQSTDNNYGVDGLLGDWEASPVDRLAQVTPEGRYLAFMSHGQPTGYDNNGLDEVFEYDADSGRLACASCDPTGEAPSGESHLSLISPLSSKYPQPRNLTEDGRLFFDSSEKLSPYDVNGSVEDVYEYESGGDGTCVRSTGCVALISSGHGTADSNFLGASASGDDVFFTTRDQLVPEDQDDLMDLYDARVNGGFPTITTPICTGTGCQGVANAPPVFATPSSVTFSGVGNFSGSNSGAKKLVPSKKAVKCTKGKKIEHGRCVKAKHAKASSKHRTTRVRGRHASDGRRAGR